MSTSGGSTLADIMARERTAAIRKALDQTWGNRTQAARLLGINRTYLQRLIREAGIVYPKRPRSPDVLA